VHVSPHNPEAQAFWRAQGYGAHMDVLHRRISRRADGGGLL